MNCSKCGEKISPGYARLKQYNDMEILLCDSCGAFSTGNESALAAEVERLQGLVDYWRSEFETTRKQRDALAAEVARLREDLVASVPVWVRERVRRWQELYQRYPEEEVSCES